MSSPTTSILAFVATVALGSAVLVGIRGVVAPAPTEEAEATKAKPAETRDDLDGDESSPENSKVAADSSAEGEDLEKGRSLSEMMAEHDRMLQAMRDAEASGDAVKLMAAVQEAEGKFRAPATIIEHSAYRAIALCKTGQLEDGQREASLWIQNHEKHSLRTKVETGCSGAPSPATSTGAPAAAPKP
jgi:hypothetical protein